MCDVHSTPSFTAQVLLVPATTLQPMSEPAQRSDVVLFNFIFGPSPYTMPTFPFFLQSAEYSGADIVFVGGQEKLACHWQHSKNTPEMAASIRVLQNSTSSTRRMPDLCGSFGRGFWRAKPKRSGDPCEVGSTRRKIFG